MSVHRECVHILQWWLSGRPQGSGVSEVALPQIKADHSLSLPQDIDRHPFSHYANTVLRVELLSFLLLWSSIHVSNQFHPFFYSSYLFSFPLGRMVPTTGFPASKAFDISRSRWCPHGSWNLQTGPCEALKLIGILFWMDILPQKFNSLYWHLCSLLDLAFHRWLRSNRMGRADVGELHCGEKPITAQH